MASKNNEFTEDIIIQILLSLDAKSLSRFKCVCKRWLAIIEDSNFINNHYNHPTNKEHLLVYNYRVEFNEYVMTCFADDTLSRYEQPIHLQLPNWTPNFVGHVIEYVIGPISGIFCILTKWFRFAIWNPAIQMFKPIPLYRPDIPLRYTPCLADTFGFGFDSITNEYKVVWVQSFSYFDYKTNKDDDYEPLVVSVYSSITDSWRCFEDDTVLDHLRPVLPRGNTYLKGFIYWWAGCGIVAFELSKEVFTEIQVPDAVQSRPWKELSLYKDSITLICFDSCSIEESIDIWLMMEGGSWAKHITIAQFLGINWNYIGSWNNKLICRTNSLEMILYDLETRETFTLEAPVQGWQIISPFVYTFKESLMRDNKDQFNRNSAEIDLFTYIKDLDKFNGDSAEIEVFTPPTFRRSTKKRPKQRIRQKQRQRFY